MNAVLEGFVVFFLSIYYCLEAFVLALLPLRRKKKVDGEIVLITGAGSGLGRLMAERFADLGCTLVLWDVNEKGNEETASIVREKGVAVHTYKCDITDKDAVYHTAGKVKVQVGNVNILVNNAGVVTGQKLLNSPDELIKKTMDVNIMAHFWTVKSFLPHMIENNHGHLVTIASAAGLFCAAGLVDYCASKHAAVGLNESIRFELIRLGKTGVKTTVVCPYYINTGMFDGVKGRFPSIFPILDPSYAVDRIIDAVLKDKPMLLLPGNLQLFMILKACLPVKVYDMLSDFIGANNTMDDFVGRKKN